MLYEELNERKKELGMTTEQLSQLSGVPVGTINKILSGETRSPRYATWQALERVLYGEEGFWDTAYGNPSDMVRETVAPYLTKRQGEYTVAAGGCASRADRRRTDISGGAYLYAPGAGHGNFA